MISLRISLRKSYISMISLRIPLRISYIFMIPLRISLRISYIFMISLRIPLWISLWISVSAGGWPTRDPVNERNPWLSKRWGGSTRPSVHTSGPAAQMEIRSPIRPCIPRPPPLTFSATLYSMRGVFPIRAIGLHITRI